jgi:hypothetical protein
VWTGSVKAAMQAAARPARMADRARGLGIADELASVLRESDPR